MPPPWPQVLADRGETGSKFGRATFSVLLLQDLAVVVLLMLIPLLAPSPDGAAAGGIAVIAKAIGSAAVKAVVTMVGCGAACAHSQSAKSCCAATFPPRCTHCLSQAAAALCASCRSP